MMIEKLGAAPGTLRCFGSGTTKLLITDSCHPEMQKNGSGRECSTGSLHRPLSGPDPTADEALSVSRLPGIPLRFVPFVPQSDRESEHRAVWRIERELQRLGSHLPNEIDVVALRAPCLFR